VSRHDDGELHYQPSIRDQEQHAVTDWTFVLCVLIVVSGLTVCFCAMASCTAREAESPQASAMQGGEK